MTSINQSQHSCSYLRGMNWHTFKYLDTRLYELSRYITLDQDNKDIWSEALADLLILTGSAVDTFFRDMGGCPYIQAEPYFKKVQSQVVNRYWDMCDFRDAYDSIYELSENEVDVPFGLRYYGKIRPFRQFKVNKNPGWWDAYNHLKHSFYKHLKEATLDNVLNCLGGLLILNSLHKCSQEYLVLHGYLKDQYGQVNPPVLAYALGQSKIGYPTRCSVGIPLRSYIQTSTFRFDLRPDENVTVTLT